MTLPPHVIAERALAAAAELDDAIAIVTQSSRADLRWARTTVTTNGESVETGLTLIGFRHGDDGTSTVTLSCSQPDDAAIAALAAAVRLGLRHAPPAEDSFPLVAADDTPSTWSDEAPRTSSAALADLSAPLGRSFESAVADGIELFGYAEHCLDTTWLASSTGLRRRHAQPAGRLEMTAKSHERSRSTWWGLACDDFHGIDLADADRAMRQGLAWQERRIRVDPGRHRTVLTPGAIGDLMVDLWWSSSAREAVEGRSVFSAPGGGTRIGERLAERALTLCSDPRDRDIPAAGFTSVPASSDLASAFDNGLALERVDWLRDGVLTHLLASRRLAADHGLPIGAAADTLRLDDAQGAGSLEDLVGRCDSGLLVTCLWYNRLVDPQTLLLTGLTRDGVYVVDGGEVVGATTNFRFNDSPVSILGRIVDAGVSGRTLPREMGDYAARVAMPPVTVEDFHLSTVSDAL